MAGKMKTQYLQALTGGKRLLHRRMPSKVGGRSWWGYRTSPIALHGGLHITRVRYENAL
jgi:hypothetical protein